MTGLHGFGGFTALHQAMWLRLRSSESHEYVVLSNRTTYFVDALQAKKQALTHAQTLLSSFLSLV